MMPKRIGGVLRWRTSRTFSPTPQRTSPQSSMFPPTSLSHIFTYGDWGGGGLLRWGGGKGHRVRGGGVEWLELTNTGLLRRAKLW